MTTTEQSEIQTQALEVFKEFYEIAKKHADKGECAQVIVGSLVALAVQIMKRAFNKDQFMEYCELAWHTNTTTPTQDQTEELEKQRKLISNIVQAIEKAELSPNSIVHVLSNFFIQTCQKVEMTEENFDRLCKTGWKVCSERD